MLKQVFISIREYKFFLEQNFPAFETPQLSQFAIRNSSQFQRCPNCTTLMHRMSACNFRVHIARWARGPTGCFFTRSAWSRPQPPFTAYPLSGVCLILCRIPSFYYVCGIAKVFGILSFRWENEVWICKLCMEIRWSNFVKLRFVLFILYCEKVENRCFSVWKLDWNWYWVISIEWENIGWFKFKLSC